MHSPRFPGISHIRNYLPWLYLNVVPQRQGVVSVSGCHHYHTRPSAFYKIGLLVDICNPTSLHHCWHVCLCICVYVCLHVSVHACLFLYVCVSIYIYIYVHVFIFLHIFIFLCVYMCICVCIHVYMCACVYLHVLCGMCVCLWRPEIDVAQNDPQAPLCPPSSGFTLLCYYSYKQSPYAL